MIVWPIVVVPAPNVVQFPLVFIPVRDRFADQCPLYGPNEPLDSPILPGAAGLDALVADPQQPKAESKPAGDEHGFIVGAEKLWLAVSFHRFCQLMQARQ